MEIFYVSIPFETNVSLFNCSTFLLRNVVSFPSYHRYIAAVIGTGVAMDIVSRSREVCSRIDLLQSLPFSDNCVNHFFFQPPPSSFSLSQQKRNSIFRAWSIESNYKQYILPFFFFFSEHHSSKSYLKSYLY